MFKRTIYRAVKARLKEHIRAAEERYGQKAELIEEEYDIDLEAAEERRDRRLTDVQDEIVSELLSKVM